MPIYSMTGFGRGMAKDGDVIVTCDIRSVNHRYLDIHFRMPRAYAPLESKLRDMAADILSRGRVDLMLSVSAPGSDSGKVVVDVQLAEIYRRQFKKLQKKLGVDGGAGLKEIIERDGVLQFVENPDGPIKAHWPTIEKAVQKALKGLHAMRRKEGSALKKEIEFHCRILKTTAKNLEKEIPPAVKNIKNRFVAKVRELAGTVKEIDSDRLAQEVAMIVAKTDVTEEVARLKAHLDQVDAFLKDGLPAGKRLDFIMQEIHREITTFGNKLQSQEVSRLLVDAKSTAEKMREQIQNVE